MQIKDLLTRRHVKKLIVHPFLFIIFPILALYVQNIDEVYFSELFFPLLVALLFFGLVLKNSKQLSSIIRGILSKKAKEKRKALKGELGVSVTTPSEEYFYHQISFFLKTFFFVYIGILIDMTD